MGVIQINHDPSRRQLNQFGGLWLVFLAGFGALAYFKAGNHALGIALWIAAVVVPLLGWTVPAFMRLVFLGLSYAAFPIGFVVSHVILAAVYYLVLTPIGLVMRLAGHDPMSRKSDREATSYWIERATADEARRYFRQF